ncbi:unnamed protein product [Cuscuta epithymum]|uniref:RING-type E3 ubiquitin transferase n=1 Tax=Cuscuta epithymum TaxID=186058 RepID=A0AAV0C2B2_9ASTE|nr:unnamed protein product [Cuscuta epithymum]
MDSRASATASERNNMNRSGFSVTLTRRARNQNRPIAAAEPDPTPEIVHSTRYKPTISALLLAPFSPISPTPTALTPKKKNFATFRRMGCDAPQKVSVPAMIRSSADWDSERVKKKKKKARSKRSKSPKFPVPAVDDRSSSSALSSSCVPGPDVWCGPGIGFSTDAASVVSRRRPPVTGRGRVDSQRVPLRERSRYSVRRMVIPEDNPFLEADSALELSRCHVDHFVCRNHRHSRYGSPEGLAEVVMLQNSTMRGRSDSMDGYRDLRLDIDNMSYEELLELGDRIGNVSTGLREDEIAHCVRKTGPPLLTNLRTHMLTEAEKMCSVCQEEYEAHDEMGTLKCGHFYHINCIKEWLLKKNACPICKSAAKSDGHPLILF